MHSDTCGVQRLVLDSLYLNVNLPENAAPSTSSSHSKQLRASDSPSPLPTSHETRLQSRCIQPCLRRLDGPLYDHPPALTTILPGSASAGLTTAPRYLCQTEEEDGRLRGEYGSTLAQDARGPRTDPAAGDSWPSTVQGQSEGLVAAVHVSTEVCKKGWRSQREA